MWPGTETRRRNAAEMGLSEGKGAGVALLLCAFALFVTGQRRSGRARTAGTCGELLPPPAWGPGVSGQNVAREPRGRSSGSCLREVRVRDHSTRVTEALRGWGWECCGQHIVCEPVPRAPPAPGAAAEAAERESSSGSVPERNLPSRQLCPRRRGVSFLPEGKGLRGKGCPSKALQTPASGQAARGLTLAGPLLASVGASVVLSSRCGNTGSTRSIPRCSPPQWRRAAGGLFAPPALPALLLVPGSQEVRGVAGRAAWHPPGCLLIPSPPAAPGPRNPRAELFLPAPTPRLAVA